MKRTGSGCLGILLALVCVSAQGSQQSAIDPNAERFTVQIEDLVAPDGVRNRLLDQEPPGAMDWPRLACTKGF